MGTRFFSRFTRQASDDGPAVPSEQRPSPVEEPAADVAEIVRGIARQGLPVAPRKAAISLRLDADVLDWFKAQGSGYQTRINAVLRAYMDAAG